MINFRRFNFLKILIVLVIAQLAVFAWLQFRNHKPEAHKDEVLVIAGKTAIIQPLRNDFDKDNDALILHKFSSPIHGTLTQDKNILTYSAKIDYVGVDSFTYIVSDGDKEGEEVYVNITVLENIKPIANFDYIQAYRGCKTMITVLGNDSDREGDSIFINDFTKPVAGNIQKIGNDFMYTSGSNSIKLDSFQYTISDGFKVSEKVTVQISVKDINEPNYPWLSVDIGNTAIKGSLFKNYNKFVVRASGADIWGNMDAFHFVYQIVNGDCEIYTKVESVDYTNQWAKSGVMIRETLDANSKNIFLSITSENGATFQYRSSTADNSGEISNITGKVVPYWVKLVRKGNNFKGFISPNGIDWTDVGSEIFPMNKNVYIGMSVTSHDNENICKTVFSNFTKIGNDPKFE